MKNNHKVFMDTNKRWVIVTRTWEDQVAVVMGVVCRGERTIQITRRVNRGTLWKVVLAENGEMILLDQTKENRDV